MKRSLSVGIEDILWECSSFLSPNNKFERLLPGATVCPLLQSCMLSTVFVSYVQANSGPKIGNGGLQMWQLVHHPVLQQFFESALCQGQKVSLLGICASVKLLLEGSFLCIRFYLLEQIASVLLYPLQSRTLAELLKPICLPNFYIA